MASIQTITPIEEELPNPAQLDVYYEGKEIKEQADALFRQKEVQKAYAKYYQVLLRWKGLVRQGNPGLPMPPPQSPASASDDKPQSQLNADLEKLYSNMSACNLSQGKWQRTIELADEALKLNKDNTKALFRKAKAQGELGFYEKAEPIFLELIRKNPAEEKNIRIELDHLRAKENAARKKADTKLKGFLSKSSKSGIFDEATKPVITYDEDNDSDDEKATKKTEEDPEAQKKADAKFKGFLKKNAKNGIFDAATTPKITYEEDEKDSDDEGKESSMTSARIEEVP